MNRAGMLSRSQYLQMIGRAGRAGEGVGQVEGAADGGRRSEGQGCSWKGRAGGEEGESRHSLRHIQQAGLEGRAQLGVTAAQLRLRLERAVNAFPSCVYIPPHHLLHPFPQCCGGMVHARALFCPTARSCAGQSAVGESFLIGRGAPFSARDEWPHVCALMGGSLPALKSCLLDVPEAAGACLSSAALRKGGAFTAQGQGREGAAYLP